MKTKQTPEILKWIIATAVFSYIVYGIVIATQNLL
jgi:hypothetical protein